MAYVYGPGQYGNGLYGALYTHDLRITVASVSMVEQELSYVDGIINFTMVIPVASEFAPDLFSGSIWEDDSCPVLPDWSDTMCPTVPVWEPKPFWA